jgi:hypothetical protein
MGHHKYSIESFKKELMHSNEKIINEKNIKIHINKLRKGIKSM